MRKLAVALLLAGKLYADARYMVDYVLPRGGTRGTTVTAEFHGAQLDNPKEIVFYQPGIKAAGFVPFAKPGDGFKVNLQIEPNCALGEHVLRVRTALALSDAVTFWVGPFPTLFESQIDKTKPIPLNTTVEGQIAPGPDQDIDVYKVEARQGQRISVEVESARLGTLHFGGENDLAVRILDSDRKELGRNDDSALYVQDPVLSILAPHDGIYLIEIKQQVFYPPKQAWYRAHIGDFSRPTAIFPAGGQSGTTIEARILGDPAGERTERINLQNEANNTLLRVSPYPNVLYAGPGTPFQVPAALNGIFTKQSQSDTYGFSAKKGQGLRIRVFARTLGAPVDPRIWIAAASNPKHILEADDSKLTDLGFPSSRGTWYTKDQQDPAVVFQPPADGDYILGIEDTTGAFGPDHVYRAEIEPVHDGFYTHITMSDGYQIPRLVGLFIPQGNRWTLDVQLAPVLGNTYKGEMELEAVGLPKGVTMIAPKFGKGVNRMPVQFIAAADAKPQSALIQLLARPLDKAVNFESGSRQGFALTNRPGELPWHFVFLDKFALAVTDPAPFHIELEQPDVPLTQSGEMLLKARVVRHGDFKDAIEMAPDWLPPGVSKEGAVTIAPDKTEATFKIQANEKAAPAVYRIAMNATTTGGDAFSGIGRIRVSSAFVDLKISEPYVTIDLQRGAIEQGKVATVTGVLRQKNAFPGEAIVTLQQLPKGIQMKGAPPKITAKDSQVVFQLEAQPDALAGLYKAITCELALTVEGQTVRQHTGSGVLRIDEARR